MKTNSRSTKFITAVVLILGTGLAIPAASAGPGSGVTIWRTTPNSKVPTSAPARELPRTCTDARLMSVKEAKWVRGAGRGMVIVDAGKALVCNSCATPVAVAKPHDRNSNGPKAAKPLVGLHECGEAGCGATVARTN